MRSSSKIALLIAAVVIFPAVSHADWRDREDDYWRREGRHERWRERHEERMREWRAPYYLPPPVYLNPPAVYNPPPVYYPPQQYYVPPPSVYIEPAW
jgi:hypothetical protein